MILEMSTCSTDCNFTSVICSKRHAENFEEKLYFVLFYLFFGGGGLHPNPYFDKQRCSSNNRMHRKKGKGVFTLLSFCLLVHCMTASTGPPRSHSSNPPFNNIMKYYFSAFRPRCDTSGRNRWLSNETAKKGREKTRFCWSCCVTASINVQSSTSFMGETSKYLLVLYSDSVIYYCLQCM